MTAPDRIYLGPPGSGPEGGRLWCEDQIEESWSAYDRADSGLTIPGAVLTAMFVGFLTAVLLRGLGLCP